MTESRSTEDRRAYFAEHYQKNKHKVKDRPSRQGEYRRNAHLVKTYGITVEQYDHMLEQQGGHCALCPAVPKRASLHVDHDHVTGRVRGILCSGCNRVLGFIEARPDWHDRAVAYLSHGGTNEGNHHER